MAQTELTHTAEVRSEAKNPTPKPPAPKPKPAAPSTTSEKESTTPNVDSPEWKREQIENERKEQHLKQVIEGICRGC